MGPGKNHSSMSKSLVEAPLPFPFVLPTYRISLSLLRSTIDLTMPPVVDEADRPFLRRQTLMVALSECGRCRGGVHSTFREARRRARSSPSMKDMLERTPKGLETPRYDVVFRGDLSGSNAYEIRRYYGYAVVSTNRKENKAPASGFNLLAGYIFGQNQSNKKMSMTTPVFMTGPNESSTCEGDTSTEGGKSMSFVLPSAFWEKETVAKSPQPVEGSDLHRSFVEPVLRAVIWYSGFTTPETIRVQEERLLRLLKFNEKFRIKDRANIVQANYNDPFTAPWKRRNEIMVEVETVN